MDIFCNVIDNFGDAGFSLRLARSLTKQQIRVNLFCDYLPAIECLLSNEDCQNNFLKIGLWPDPCIYVPSDTVIEAFSCRLPDKLLSKIKIKNSIVIELDYLTAEKFADECHGLSSSSNGINSYFFFPGFTPKTGGLILDDAIPPQTFIHKNSYKKDNQQPLSVTVFSYENPKIKFVMENLLRGKENYELKFFEGKPLLNINYLYRNINLRIGSYKNLSNLKLIGCKMTDQKNYDKLLSNSDLNLVRGEESAVRGMLCGKPFLWHIYPQADKAHIIKLKALFECMKTYLPTKTHKNIDIIRDLNLEYNGEKTGKNFPIIEDFLPEWNEVTNLWSEHLFSLGSLTQHLINFIEEKKLST